MIRINSDRVLKFKAIGTNLIVSGFGFVNYLVLIRIFSDSDFGYWTLIVSVISIIDLFRFGFTRNGLMKFITAKSSVLMEKKFISASYKLTILISLALLICIFVLSILIFSSSHFYFVVFVGLFIVVNIPLNLALNIAQTKLNFNRILKIRIIQPLMFLSLLFVVHFFTELNLKTVLTLLLIPITCISVFCVYKNYDGSSYLKLNTYQQVRELFSFGKYSSLSLIGSNLLRSSDLFMLGSISFLDISVIKYYSLGFKIIEIIEIPLRGYSVVLFSKLCEVVNRNHYSYFQSVLFINIRRFTTFLFPFLILFFMFSDELVYLFSGENIPIASNLVKIFCFYALVLVLDRFTGLALESVGLPSRNTQKVFVMLASNFLLNSVVFITLYILHQQNIIDSAFLQSYSLYGIAFVSFVFTVIGSVIGIKFLNAFLRVKLLKLNMVSKDEKFNTSCRKI
ncbi:MAG: hypothetical protein ACEPOW_10665 [Bacteroidales bacterium]